MSQSSDQRPQGPPPSPPSSSSPPAPQSEPGLGKGVQITIGVLVVAALLGWYGYTNLEQGASFQYFQTLDEFIAERQTKLFPRSRAPHTRVSNRPSASNSSGA